MTTTLQTAATLCEAIDSLAVTTHTILHKLINENGNEIVLDKNNRIPYRFMDGYEKLHTTTIYLLTTESDIIVLRPNDSKADSVYIHRDIVASGGVSVTTALKAVVKQLTATAAKQG